MTEKTKELKEGQLSKENYELKRKERKERERAMHQTLAEQSFVNQVILIFT